MRPLVILAPVLALGLVGCAQRTPVGKWDVNINAQGKQYPSVVEIKSDGTQTWVITVPGQKMGPLEIPEFQMDAVGTWKSDGKTFTSTMTDIKVSDSAPDMIKAGFELGKKQMLEQLGKTRTTNLAYKDSGSMEMSSPDGAVVVFIPHKA